MSAKMSCFRRCVVFAVALMFITDTKAAAGRKTGELITACSELGFRNFTKACSSEFIFTQRLSRKGELCHSLTQIADKCYI